MTDDSFGKTPELLLTIGKKYTFFGLFEWWMELNGISTCTFKVPWTTQQKMQHSFGFQKKSPLLPFFNHVYVKLLERGSLDAIFRRWKPPAKSVCSDGALPKMPISNLVLLLAILGSAIIIATIILFCENSVSKTSFLHSFGIGVKKTPEVKILDYSPEVRGSSSKN